MAGLFSRKYATGSGADVYMPVRKAGSNSFAKSADWTPATGDVKISIDGAATNNITTLPTAVAMGNSAYWVFTFSNAELTGKKITVMVANAAVSVDDDYFEIETFGHASALYPTDFTQQLALQSDVANIGVTSAALNTVATSQTVTTGTDTGGFANTVALDGTYDSVADAAGTTDFYYEFNVGTYGAGTGANWVGYLVGVLNTMKVYAYNWGGASWDQVGTINGISGTLNGSQDFDLTNSHTGTGGNVGKVRIRFQNTGLTSSSLKTDRILVGYTNNVSGASLGFPTNFSTLLISGSGHISNVDTLTTYTGDTPQTGDAYAIVNNATYGNAKLVRSTTPSNTLTVNSSNQAITDVEAIGGVTNANIAGLVTLGAAYAVGTLTANIIGNITGALSGSVGSVTGLTASDIAAIKAQTDKLHYTLASGVNYVDVNIGGVRNHFTAFAPSDRFPG